MSLFIDLTCQVDNADSRNIEHNLPRQHFLVSSNNNPQRRGCNEDHE